VLPSQGKPDTDGLLAHTKALLTQSQSDREQNISYLHSYEPYLVQLREAYSEWNITADLAIPDLPSDLPVPPDDGPLIAACKRLQDTCPIEFKVEAKGQISFAFCIIE
jgi:hypothetical protein